MIVFALVLLLLAAGCSSWRGARLYQSGSRALEAGEVDRALEELREAARLAPDASEVRNHLGLAWLAAGDEQQALRSFEQAVALDCDNGAASENLARTRRQLREEATRRVSLGRPQADDHE